MPNQTSPYYITRTCQNCGNKDDIYLTKKQKAFELYNFNKVWNQECTVCKSTECYSVGGFPIELDKELLLEWALDSSLHINPQDDEIILAEERYIDMMIDVLDNYDISEIKKRILVEALCIIIYDSIIGRDEDIEILHKNEALIERVAAELIKRQPVVLAAGRYISDYIKQIVYPRIGLPINGV